MNDRDKLKALLAEFGVGFECFGDEGKDMICREGAAKVDGYSQFCTHFEFTPDGKFIQMGAWE